MKNTWLICKITWPHKKNLAVQKIKTWPCKDISSIQQKTWCANKKTWPVQQKTWPCETKNLAVRNKNLAIQQKTWSCEAKNLTAQIKNLDTTKNLKSQTKVFLASKLLKFRTKLTLVKWTSSTTVCLPVTTSAVACPVVRPPPHYQEDVLKVSLHGYF